MGTNLAYFFLFFAWTINYVSQRLCGKSEPLPSMVQDHNMRMKHFSHKRTVRVMVPLWLAAKISFIYTGPEMIEPCERERVPLRACTLVSRSKVSLSCRCFPVLLARSIHLPLNHFTVGLRRRSLASTLAMKWMSAPWTSRETNTCSWQTHRRNFCLSSQTKELNANLLRYPANAH